MSESLPGFSAIIETEEAQLWASGPDNNHKRFLRRMTIKSTVTDSGNSPTSTLRAGNLISVKDSDGLGYKYSATATDGTQNVNGVLEKHLSMLDKNGTAENKFTKILTAGILKNYSADLVGVDNAAMAVLLRIGFTVAGAPHGSSFLLHPRARYFKTADYTVVAADHGCMFVAATNAVNFTLPDLATVGRGWSAMFYNSVDASMVITGAADTILFGDAGGGLSTTLTYSTANKKIGGTAIMYADYNVSGTLNWYVLTSGTVPVSA